VPRPRTQTDEAVLEAALVLMRRGGPAALTFAALAKTSGLAGATLVQRFGGRDALLEAALQRAWDQLDDLTAQTDLEYAETPIGAVALLVALSGPYGGPEDHAEGLLLLREDFRHAALRARGVAWGKQLARALGRRLSADPQRQPVLGRMMASQWQGALLWWGFARDGDVGAYVRRELEAWCAACLKG